MWRKNYHNLLSPLIQFIQYQFLILWEFSYANLTSTYSIIQMENHLLQIIQELLTTVITQLLLLFRIPTSFVLYHLMSLFSQVNKYLCILYQYLLKPLLTFNYF
ncbi:unnamed protein product [Paramecium sonneborni]|uniref:Transmembrane protein n=1 Tax=Paramecium sonneborni TaxID=65129 RepID=A0A8S1PN20_9CILI|nr:unnamed protein product [Paramecium sonneborni]